jgi:hypothetical protein
VCRKPIYLLCRNMQTPLVQKRNWSQLLALLAARRTTLDSESREICEIHVELNGGHSHILLNVQTLYVVPERCCFKSTEDENARVLTALMNSSCLRRGNWLAVSEASPKVTCEQGNIALTFVIVELLYTVELRDFQRQCYRSMIDIQTALQSSFQAPNLSHKPTYYPAIPL